MSPKYWRRTIALGPPYDDGTVPGEERPADASGRPPTILRALAADQPSNARSSNKPSRQYTHPADEKARLIRDIRARLPLVAIERPELAAAIGQAMDTVDAAPERERLARQRALADRLAEAILEARAGASGPFDGTEQLRRTRLMAEWVIARLPFHDLALVEVSDGLTDEQRTARYRDWLRKP